MGSLSGGASWVERLRTALVLVVCLAAPGSAATIVVGAAPGDELDERLDHVLERASGSPATSIDALARQLTQLGRDVLPRLVQRMDREHERPSSLPAAREALRTAAGAFGRSAVVPLLRECGAREATLAERRTALALLADVGLATDLPLALAVASPPGRPTEELITEFLATFGAIFVRDERVDGKLKRLLLEAPVHLRGRLVSALGDRGRRATLRPLAGLLGTFPGLDAALVGAVGRIGERAGPPLEEPVRTSVHRLLFAEALQVRRETGLALGRMDDFDACADLVQLLGSEEASLREAACWSLNHMTGLGFSPDQRRWEMWLRREESWFHSRAEELRADIDSPDHAPALAAINELAGRRYRRHQLAATVARAVDHPHPTVRLHGCLALRQIGSAAGNRALIAGLDDVDLQVADEAWKSLRSITGEDLPMDADAWEEALHLR